MAGSSKNYLLGIRKTLNESLCVEYFPSPVVERHAKPEVEVRHTPMAATEAIEISKNSTEFALIEPSINSCRFSVSLKKLDDVETFLTNKFTRFMEQRAENFQILRRKAVKGYDLSFLVVDKNVEYMVQDKLVDFIVQFLEEVDKEISEMKINVNARARNVAEEWLRSIE